MNKNLVLMVALVTNFCVAGLTAGDPFIEQVAELCRLVPTAYCLRSLQAVTIHNVGPVYSFAFDIPATEMEACFLYKNTTEKRFKYCVCNDCGAFLANGIDAHSHFFSNLLVIKGQSGGYLNPTDHPKNPALEKLERVGTSYNYTCNVCASGVPIESVFQAVGHVESEHPDEDQKHYQQQIAAQSVLVQSRTTSVILRRTDFKTVGALALSKGNVWPRT